MLPHERVLWGTLGFTFSLKCKKVFAGIDHKEKGTKIKHNFSLTPVIIFRIKFTSKVGNFTHTKQSSYIIQKGKERERRKRERERVTNMSSCDRHAILILALFSILFTTSQSSLCSEALKRNNTATCRVLPTLGAEFGWNFTNNKSQIDIYFTAKLDAEMGWVAWGLNPGERPQMVGTRALIGIRYPNGTLSIDKYNITADTKLGCHLQPSNIDVVVRKMRPEYSSETGYFTIYATLVLPMEYNMSKLHHVWQVGYNVEGVVPKKHPTTLQNVDSTDTINLWTRKSQSIGKHRHHLRMVRLLIS